MTLGSLFDGIGGFPLAGILNGITPVWASEIEPFPISVTKKHFPDMFHFGDITKLKGSELPPVDIITGGSPCQDLSVAGARAGLTGERSGLFMEQIRIVKEMRCADEQLGRTTHAVRPRYMVWENVPGAFSSGEPHGEDFRVVLEEIARIADDGLSVPRPPGGVWKSAGCILGHEFSVAWRVLDTQYWPGTPQRRRRIFIVADFGGQSASKILFEQESLFGNPAESQNPREGTATPTRKSVEDTGGSEITAFAANQRDEVRDLYNVAGAIQAQPGMKQQTFVAVPQDNCLTPWDIQQERVFTPESVAPTLAGADGGGGRNPAGLLFSAGFCATASSEAKGIGYQEECAPTLKSAPSGTAVICLNDQGGNQMYCSEEITGTLRAQEHGHQPLVMKPQPLLYENHSRDARYTGPHKVSPTIAATAGMGGNNLPLVTQEDETYCIAGNIIGREDENGGNGFGYQSDISYTVTATDRHAIFSRQRSDLFKQDEITATQTARQCRDSTDLVIEPNIYGQSQFGMYADGCTTLRANGGDNGGGSENLVVKTNLIRRLTPLECERLQGFPDLWTDIGSDTARYKALGNSVSVNVVAYVLRGIAYFLLKQKEENNETNIHILTK